MASAPARPLIVGIGGTVRSPSSSERVLTAALAAAEAAGARTQLFGGEILSRLPIYNPADPGEPPERSALVEAVRNADGVIVATPGYHGSLSGLIKNALDSLEPLSSAERPYLDGRAVGCIVVADGWQAWLGATVNSALKPFDEDGALKDPRDIWQVETVAQQVVAFAKAFSR